MRTIKEYTTIHGCIRIIAMDELYSVIFSTMVRPGLVYHKEIPHLSYDEAIAKYNAIAQIYKYDTEAKCGFNKKAKCVCRKSNCPYVLGNRNFWDYSSYDCFYRGR